MNRRKNFVRGQKITLRAELTERLIVSGSSRSLRSECVECGRIVDWLTPEEFSAWHGRSLREVYRAVEANELHFTELAAGSILICGNSASKLF